MHIFAVEESTGISAVGLDPWALLAQGVTFLLLLWVLKRFALGKIVDTLEKRRKTIEDGVRFAEEMKDEKAKFEERMEELITKAQERADKLVAEGKTDAAELIKQAEAEAAKRMEKILADARSQVDQDIEKARKELEKEVVSLIAQTSEVVLGEKLDSQRDMDLIKRELREVRK